MMLNCKMKNKFYKMKMKKHNKIILSSKMKIIKIKMKNQKLN